MCFTIEVHLTRKAIEKRFAADTSALYDFDFNYFYRAFDHPLIPVITQEDPGKVQLMEWGLIPAWAGDLETANRIRKGTYNARAESLHEKPSFRQPFQRGRCWVIAHGFFEWQQRVQGKIPWYVRLRNDDPFAFAGLYDRWRDPVEGNLMQTFTIITTRANPLLEKIHNTKQRMPVILHRDNEADWINSDLSLHRSAQLLIPFPEGQLHAHTVSNRLLHAETRPDDPAVIRPYEPPSPGKLF
ncbi:MAG TPA: SOS response-associated peptidase [Bacteroides sp.]|nr:SOS response-associated peptidase [Bacteroides sp.]